MRGADLLADSVAVTLGPAGRCVMIEAQGGGPRAPRITKDGVTVADALEVEGRLEKMGLRLMRRAAQRIGEDIGDGTTTTASTMRVAVTTGSAVSTMPNCWLCARLCARLLSTCLCTPACMARSTAQPLRASASCRARDGKKSRSPRCCPPSKPLAKIKSNPRGKTRFVRSNEPEKYAKCRVSTNGGADKNGAQR